MNRRGDLTLIVAGILLILTAGIFMTLGSDFNSPSQRGELAAQDSSLLSDPFLQYPTESSVRVVWFTEFEGLSHAVVYGQPGQVYGATDLSKDVNTLSVEATTTKLSRVQEDQDSQVQNSDSPSMGYDRPTQRQIWRHEAEVTGLAPGRRLPYQVMSLRQGGQMEKSGVFSLAPTPPAGQSLKILLTSDHQLMPMTSANLQKAAEIIAQGEDGEEFRRLDAVFLAGDLVNVPDRASEWFDDERGRAFFPSLQGRANYTLERNGRPTVYRGGEIIQHAPLFPAIGNHEVMGRLSPAASLKQQFGDSMPWQAAVKRYEQEAEVFNPKDDPEVRRTWLKNNSFNTDTYEEIFTLPASPILNAQGEIKGKTTRYYSLTFGDVRLISLFVTNVWRSPDLTPNTRGRYRERSQDLNKPDNWGYGQHIFASIAKDSPQYRWLERELASDAFQQAKYKIVMLHHPPHGLGGNIVPAFTDPVQVFDRRPDGSLKAIRYEYPKGNDYIIRDLMPLLEQAGVQLVFYGHSHLWNRFTAANGMHFLETSNVGNSYGAFLAAEQRKIPPSDPIGEDLEGFQEAYAATGDPNGLEPKIPTLAPLKDDQGRALPYIASNDITAFSILDTGTGTISSYYFDTRKPNSAVVKFDEFSLGGVSD